MIINLIHPRKALNKAFLKVKPTRSQVETFKNNLIALLDGLDESESEEHNKNDLADFLKNTFYNPAYYINTRGRADLVIHNGSDSRINPGVLIEVKRPGNRTEMTSKEDLKAKAFYELILYFLRERITNSNLDIKHLIVTNVYEWFIFDATWFEKTFAQNKSFINQFNDFEQGRLSGTDTGFFYDQVAAPFIKEADTEIPFIWFDFRDYNSILRNSDKADDAKLIPLFKVLSPEHLLKLPFANDSNTLDKSFYSELLHIIGLSETKSGSKKIIERKKDGQRDPGSFIENTIVQLESRDKIARLPKPSAYGDTHQDRLFNVSLELAITWLNRILFLKLLEAQLIRYHKGDPEYGFLNISCLEGYDDLDNLFFCVLARKPENRDSQMAGQFSRIPYLNSSLFEPTELEQITIFISNLQDNALIPILPSTVLKDGTGRRRTGRISGLQYLFEFLDAYDFAGEGSEDIQEDNKTLINASVLGLIFEKINGYKDGSFFTPGFITMYMCRETIRRAVVQKFNETKNWTCESLDQVYDKIEDRQDANKVINSLRICDPAVGSGHFLVSALNEIIAIKSDLKILSDLEGRRLKEYRVEVANDELVITDEEGDLFEYCPGNNESQRIQEALFREKQTIIENCLFGVDINPNSVKICRLRLWIELLKNAYYKAESDFTELETLPNIDINIKCGNSLVSRYTLDADIRQTLKKSKWTVENYRLAVMTYRNATTKEEKREMERLISLIKSDFETDVKANDKRIIKLHLLQGDLLNLTTQTLLFEQSKRELAEWNKKVQNLTSGVQKLEQELEEIKNNKIYENAFEWRFEFPEVLNDDGDFVGFDVVIGNPPYGAKINKAEDKVFREKFYVSNYQIDTYCLFTELGTYILKLKGLLNYIVPSTWFASVYDIKLRRYLFDQQLIYGISLCPKNTFEEAVVETCLIHVAKYSDPIDSIKIFNLDGDIINSIPVSVITSNDDFHVPVYSSDNEQKMLTRIKKSYPKVDEFFEAIWGIKIYQKGKGNPSQDGNESINKAFHSKERTSETHKKLIGGSEIYPYKLIWKGAFVNYGPWIAEPRSPDWFAQSPRIVVREVTSNGRIFATYIEDEFVFSNSVDGIRSKAGKKEELLQLLGILNSKLASYIHLKTSANSQKDSFPKVLVQNLRQFPFSAAINTRLIELVEFLLTSSNDIEKEDFTEISSQIDHLVFELYGLTEEEISIVENS